jgi:myo-inositol 2-dehydrogenase/D-chiro-inositol 1-dehydrogenase
MESKKPRSEVSRRSILGAGVAAAGLPFLGSLPASSLANVLGANDAIRLGWIGVGGRGSSILRGALDNASVSNLRVNAICDIDPAARERAIQACGAMKPEGVHDYRELLKRGDIDAVFIATPIYLHAEHASAALDAGKHVYCEKPLGRTPEEVKAIYDAAKRSKKKFQTGFQWRYHSGFRGFVDTVQGGAVGRVTFVDAARHVAGYPDSGWYADRNLSGDLIVEQAVHEMNVFCWLLGSHPLAACGFGGINALEKPGRSIMDAYSVVYEFPQNLRVTYSHVIYAANGFGGLHMTVFGEAGRACELVDTVELYVTKDGKRTKIDQPALEDATEDAIRHFVRCVREDERILCDVEAGRRATLMAILGRTAMHERRVVEWKEVALEA